MKRLLLALLVGALAHPSPAASLELATANTAELQAALSTGALSSERLVQLYLARIAAYDQQGPKLNAVIHLNPNALTEAKALDAERKQSGARGPLHGIPVVLKDLVDVAGLPTTGGFKPFGDPLPARDSAVAARLKAAGAIILAKVNTANWFGNGFDHTSRIGATHNPYKLGYSPGTSSNGTGAAISAWFAAVGVGTDTGGSVVIPSAFSGITGMVATQGLVSRAGIMPRGATQDRAGPMTRNVYDLAVMLTVMGGWDVEDLMTHQGLGHFPQPDWPAQVASATLAGKRIGVLREMIATGSEHAEGTALFNRAVEDLRRGGAQVMDPILTGLDLRTLSSSAMGRTAEYEKIPNQNAYLARFGANAPFKTIQEMIEKVGPDQFSKAMLEALKLPAPGESADYEARVELRTLLRGVITELCAKYELDALVLPFSTLPPPLLSAGGTGGGNSLASNNGLPAVIVPGGLTESGLPIGIQFLGAPFTDLAVLKVAAGYEKVSARRVSPPTTPALAGETITY